MGVFFTRFRRILLHRLVTQLEQAPVVIQSTSKESAWAIQCYGYFEENILVVPKYWNMFFFLHFLLLFSFLPSSHQQLLLHEWLFSHSHFIHLHSSLIALVIKSTKGQSKHTNKQMSENKQNGSVKNH